ncbi:MAG: ABC transporter permease subunit [Candidatus Lokiarchaeota archaeon]|nr:ABC transporter permease subunit [Candidatus Lokiarchaeota archaeon]
MTIERTNTELWYSGLGNLIHRDLFLERGGKFWIQQTSIWTLMTSGIAMLLLMLPEEIISQAGPRFEIAYAMFFFTTSFIVSLFLPVILQGAIIDEAERGVTSWILSKPVSRSAYIMGKLLASSLIFVLITALLQGFLSFILFTTLGGPFDTIAFISAIGLVIILILYFTSLVIMLGTLTDNRSVVMATALAITLGTQIMANFVPQILFVVPLQLPVIGASIALGAPALGIEIMFLSTILQIGIFVMIALWSFGKKEI